MANRRQRVVMGEATSEWLDVLSGVPQGSVLGPLLFIIFINDLPGAVKQTLKLFADDSKLISTIKNRLDITQLQNDIDNLVKWSNDWQMTFNKEKCKYMVVKKGTLGISLNNIELVINDQSSSYVMENTKIERDLGIYISDDLKWKFQATQAANKANSVLGRLKKAFKCWNISTFKLLYTCFVRPHLEYAVSAWSPYLKGDIKILEKIQRRATKLIPSIKNFEYNKRLELLNLTTLEERRKRGDLINYFKITNGLNKVEWFNPNRLSVDRKLTTQLRGKEHSVIRQFTHIPARDHFLSNRIVEDWNNLPENIVKAKTTNNFKNKLDTFLTI